jgi:hypothetical protein
MHTFSYLLNMYFVRMVQVAAQRQGGVGKKRQVEEFETKLTSAQAPSWLFSWRLESTQWYKLRYTLLKL